MDYLEIMPTGEAEIIGKKNGFYIVKFDSGEEIYIPKKIIDKAKQEEGDRNAITARSL